MFNELIPFDYEGKEVRTAMINGKPMVCLADACRVLEIKNPSQAKTRLKAHGVISSEVIDSLGRTQTADFINESNLYRLVMQSRKKEAEKFGDWVVEEVLPSIRETGRYVVGQSETREVALLSEAYLVACRKMKEMGCQIAEQTKLLEEQKPMVEFATHVADSTDTIDIGTFAKLLHDENTKLGRNTLFRWMRENKYLMEDNIPYQQYIDAGYFEVIEQTFTTPYLKNGLSTKTLVTGKGQIYFTEKLRKWVAENGDALTSGKKRKRKSRK